MATKNFTTAHLEKNIYIAKFQKLAQLAKEKILLTRLCSLKAMTELYLERVNTALGS